MAYQAIFRDGEALARHALSPAFAAFRVVGQVIDKALALVTKYCLRPQKMPGQCRARLDTFAPLLHQNPPDKRETADEAEWVRTSAHKMLVTGLESHRWVAAAGDAAVGNRIGSRPGRGRDVKA
jgi:hypothetical protein